MSNTNNEFLKRFAALVKEFNAEFHYTTDDDGIHIDLDGKNVYVGFLDSESLVNFIDEQGDAGERGTVL